MENSEELFVGIVPRHDDFEILQTQKWYHLPVDKSKRYRRKRWPPVWIAFYYPGAIMEYPHQIIHYARIVSITEASRKELFPIDKYPHKAKRKYFKISFDKLETLPKPILSRRWRRINFIQTTYKKFINAVEINDLYDGSTLEDRLWAELKRNKIEAQRQEHVEINEKHYFLDFAIYCKRGKIDIETDGDKWHHNPKKAEKDNFRDNELKTDGWQVIRFAPNVIREKLTSYCIPTIAKSVNQLGGIEFDQDSINYFMEYNPGTEYPTYFEEYE